MTPILVLGGTTEGYDLAVALSAMADIHVITALAGRTTAPRQPRGEMRRGGFGGTDGLAAFLRARNIAAVIDATHPFAAAMGHNAARACADCGVPLLRFERPAWQQTAGDRWVDVDDWSQAIAVLKQGSRRVLLAIGRQELTPFAALDDVWFLVRSVEAPDPMPPFRHAELLLTRGPFDLAVERALLSTRQIDTIVCKNSGGTSVAAKLAAARELGIQVVMKRRPRRPDGTSVATLADALAWVRALTPR